MNKKEAQDIKETNSTIKLKSKKCNNKSTITPQKIYTKNVNFRTSEDNPREALLNSIINSRIKDTT